MSLSYRRLLMFIPPFLRRTLGRGEEGVCEKELFWSKRCFPRYEGERYSIESYDDEHKRYRTSFESPHLMRLIITFSLSLARCGEFCIRFAFLSGLRCRSVVHAHPIQRESLRIHPSHCKYHIQIVRENIRHFEKAKCGT